jgi:hypothetical protein
MCLPHPLDLSSSAMAPILRGAPLGSENEGPIFAFFTLVSYIDPHAPYWQTDTIEMEGCHEQKKKNAVYVCACVVLLRRRSYRGGDISKIQRR